MNGGCSGFAASQPVPLDHSQEGNASETQAALALVRQMSEFLATQPSIRFDAEIRYDAVQTSGQRIEFGSLRRVALRYPDRARVEVSHWDGDQELAIFDGSRLSVVVPDLRVYATVPFEGSVGEAFDHLVGEHQVAAPLSDLLRRDLAEVLERHALSGRRVGRVTIRGVSCDQLAFRGERVDFQLFIQRGAEPVPMRFLIDYPNEDGSPQFRAQLHSWDWSTALPDSMFYFAPPAGTQRVSFSEIQDLLLGLPERDEQ